MKMKRTELLTLNETFDRLAKVAETRFAYLIVKNQRAIKDEVESINAARKPPEGFDKFQQERQNLINEFAAKDDKGNPIKVGETGVKLDNSVEFQRQAKLLEQKYETMLTALTAKEIEVVKFLGEDIEVTLQNIHMKYLPKDLTPMDINALFPVLDGDFEDLPLTSVDSKAVI